MNKLDLIIDALEKAKDGWQSFDEYEKALAAARELRDAESKKAQWGNPKYLIEEAVLAEREACAKLCEKYADVLDPLQPESVCADYFQGGVKSAARRNAQRIRARSEPSPAFKNYMGDNWAGIV